MKVRIATKIIVFLALSFGLTLNAGDRVKSSLPQQFTDSVKARYGVKLSVPKKFVADVLSEATIWSLAANGKYGNPMWSFFASLISDDHNCMVLLESTTAYEEERIKGEIKNNTGNLRRELSYILSDGESGYYGRAKLGDFSKSLVEYGRSKSRRQFGADNVYSYSVPHGKTAFCYIHPSVDEKVPYMQTLFKSDYPEMRRFFFIKEGHATYSLTMLLTPNGAKHEKHYAKMLRKIVKYDD